MKRLFLSLALVAGAALSASAQVQLNLANTVDLAGQFPGGVAPSAVAWNGTDAFVATYNNSGTSGLSTGIVRVSNALTATPTIGTQFGSLTTNNSRGFTSLALATSGNSTYLAASWDNGGGSANSVQGFDVSNGATPSSALWNLSASGRTGDRGNGVAFDPGFNGAGTGFAYLGIGGGFSRVLGLATGAAIGGTLVNQAPIPPSNSASTTWRDVTFSPTGDFYARESNSIIKGTRTGPTQVNNGAVTTPIGGLTRNGGVDNDNIAFVNSLGGSFLVFNDRASGAGGQLFSNVVKATDTSGNAQTVTYGNFDPTSVTGNAAYDFAFNANTNTLAVSDFSQQKLYIFNVAFGSQANAPEPGSLLLLANGAALGALLLRRRKA